ncbi:MAG: hypothetical protein LBH21_05255, partial [Gracilibacteraceae bacterium]|nr:hypothetical protein [Gracilibacteraceae bacterium]
DEESWRSRLLGGSAAGTAAEIAAEISAGLRNNFEPVIAAVLPVTAAIKALLLREGCLGALLTGSGSAVFGLPPTAAAGERAARRAEAELPCRAWVVGFAAGEAPAASH